MTNAIVLRGGRVIDPANNIDAQTGKILNEAIELLNMENYQGAAAKINTLNLDKLSPYERGTVERILFSISYAQEKFQEARGHLQKAIDSGGLNAQQIDEAKYQAGVSRTTDAPELGSGPRARMRELARAAFAAIGASGFARVDFLMVGGRIYVSEINTIPGFTPISLFPMLVAAAGHDFGAACERIVALALERSAVTPQRLLSRADLP